MILTEQQELENYRRVRAYTLQAVTQAVAELEDCIKDPQNESIIQILNTRKNELIKVLENLKLCE